MDPKGLHALHHVALRCPGEQWLQERIASWDVGNRRRRKELLEEFVDYVKQSSLTGMEEIDVNHLATSST